MRVDGPIPLPENVQPQKVERARAGSNQNSTAAVPSSQDQAQLSVSSEKIGQLKATLASVPEIRQERVAPLRQAINDGSYQVSDQQLADAIHSDLVTGDSNTPR
jgi:negative regulator of flagellin synthesis FlgM